MKSTYKSDLDGTLVPPSFDYEQVRGRATLEAGVTDPIKRQRLGSIKPRCYQPAAGEARLPFTPGAAVGVPG